MRCPHCGQETETKKSSNTMDENFMAFWEVYPSRRGGQRWPEARRNFARLVQKENVKPYLLISKARDYAAYCHSPTDPVPPRYVMQAATFLGEGGGWEEDWSTETPFDQARRQLQETS